MKKVVVLVLLSFMFAFCGSMYSARPADALMGGDPGVGAWFGRQIWGGIKGCWKAYVAPEDRKWEAFKEGYKEGTEGTEGKIAELVGGGIAY